MAQSPLTHPFSLPPLSLSISPYLHRFWHVLLTVISICIELFYVSLCWSALTGVTMCRSPRKSCLWVFPYIFRSANLRHIHIKWPDSEFSWVDHIHRQHTLIYWGWCKRTHREGVDSYQQIVDLSNKIKRDFSQAVAVSVLLYDCPKWSLTKLLEKKIWTTQEI